MIERRFESGGMEGLAVFSDDEEHRYVLRRVWESEKGRVVFIGLNPSTADESKNDPTVSRMIAFSKAWGFGSLSICNLFAFRATLPANLKKALDPVGEANNDNILKEISEAEKIIACWGNHGKFLGRSDAVLKLLGRFEHFGLTKQGEPKHVLYLRKDCPLEVYG